MGGGPRVVVSTAAFHARVRGSVPGLGGFKETKIFLPHPRVKVSIVGSLRDREVACSASDRQGSNFESCVWRTVSSHSSHHSQEVLLAQFSQYVHKGGLKPDSFHLLCHIVTSLICIPSKILYRPLWQVPLCLNYVSSWVCTTWFTWCFHFWFTPSRFSLVRQTIINTFFWYHNHESDEIHLIVFSTNLKLYDTTSDIIIMKRMGFI